MIKSVGRTNKVLDLVSEHKDGLTHSEIAEALKIPHSSLFSLLSDLVSLSYLNIDKSSRRYTLGPKLLVLAGHYLSNLTIVQIGRHFLSQAMALTGECVSLAVLNGQEIMILGREDGHRPIRRTLYIGERAPIYATCAGKAMLAFHTDKLIDEYLSTTKLIPFTKKTVTDPDILRKELKTIRASSLAYHREEYLDGITAMAVPVFDVHGHPAASINISIPTFRLNKDTEKHIEHTLRAVSAAFSNNLQYDRMPKGSLASTPLR